MLTKPIRLMQNSSSSLKNLEERKNKGNFSSISKSEIKKMNKNNNHFLGNKLKNGYSSNIKRDPAHSKMQTQGHFDQFKLPPWLSETTKREIITEFFFDIMPEKVIRKAEEPLKEKELQFKEEDTTRSSDNLSICSSHVSSISVYSSKPRNSIERQEEEKAEISSITSIEFHLKAHEVSEYIKYEVEEFGLQVDFDLSSMILKALLHTESLNYKKLQDIFGCRTNKNYSIVKVTCFKMMTELLGISKY